jgi:transcriptional regulator with XRE-family HTH domain
MPDTSFNFDGFYRAVDGRRRRVGLTWKEVASAVGVSASTLTRLTKGSHPDVNTLAALADWADLNLGEFSSAKSGSGNRPSVETVIGYLHSDPNLSADAANALEALITATYSQLRSDNKP